MHSKEIQAVQHKFNSLLTICNKQEAHIFNLYRSLEVKGFFLKLYKKILGFTKRKFNCRFKEKFGNVSHRWLIVIFFK